MKAILFFLSLFFLSKSCFSQREIQLGVAPIVALQTSLGTPGAGLSIFGRYFDSPKTDLEINGKYFVGKTLLMSLGVNTKLLTINQYSVSIGIEGDYYQRPLYGLPFTFRRDVSEQRHGIAPKISLRKFVNPKLMLSIDASYNVLFKDNYLPSSNALLVWPAVAYRFN